MKIRSRGGAHRTSKRPPMFTYLMYILVATVVFTGVTFSGYISTSSGGDEARVAKFEITENVIGGTEPFYVSASLIPGESHDVTLKVDNKSEVAVDYTVTVTQETDNLPLEFWLDGGSNFTGEIGAGESKDFKLSISWPATANDPMYAGMVDSISITLDAVQKD